MSIKIREPEPTHEVSLSKQGWLEVLAFLTESLDTVSAEALALTAEAVIKAAREFVLSKGQTPEFKFSLSREQTLDLYLFFGEYRDVVKENTVLNGVQAGFKSFLLGGSE